jgi:hypothetical protein
LNIAETKLSSFQRQLNIYGFRKVNRGDEQGCYFHPKFRKGRKDLLHEVKRVAIKSIHDGVPPSPPPASPPKSSSPKHYNHHQSSPVLVKSSQVIIPVTPPSTAPLSGYSTIESRMSMTPRDSFSRNNASPEFNAGGGFSRKDLFPFSFYPIYSVPPGRRELPSVTTAATAVPREGFPYIEEIELLTLLEQTNPNEIIHEKDFNDFKDMFFSVDSPHSASPSFEYFDELLSS